MILRYFVAYAVMGFLYLQMGSILAFENIKTELPKETAWMGEPVQLIITLYSPGPFSGTPAFDLPEIPKTAILKIGNPLVGSEEINNESYITQRHEFLLFSQLEGEVSIPAFSIRFSGKKSFTSDAEPMLGKTKPVTFRSKRPAGTEAMELVLSTGSLKLEQKWSSIESDELKAGDVLERTITRKASDTSSMMFSPVSIENLENVKIYQNPPEVQDKTERGETIATRIDTLKYQFTKPGEYQLPDIQFQWWNPKGEKLEQGVLSGKLIKVTQSNLAVITPEQAPPPKSSFSLHKTLKFFFISLALGFLVWQVLSRISQKIRTHYNLPESVAIRKIKSACNEKDAMLAYQSFLDWFHATSGNYSKDEIRSFLNRSENASFKMEWDLLSQSIYAKGSQSSWNPQSFWERFSSTSKQKNEVQRRTKSPLPKLNP